MKSVHFAKRGLCDIIFVKYQLSSEVSNLSLSMVNICLKLITRRVDDYNAWYVAALNTNMSVM